MDVFTRVNGVHVDSNRVALTQSFQVDLNGTVTLSYLGSVGLRQYSLNLNLSPLNISNFSLKDYLALYIFRNCFVEEVACFVV